MGVYEEEHLLAAAATLQGIFALSANCAAAVQKQGSIIIVLSVLERFLSHANGGCSCSQLKLSSRSRKYWYIPYSLHWHPYLSNTKNFCYFLRLRGALGIPCAQAAPTCRSRSSWCSRPCREPSSRVRAGTCLTWRSPLHWKKVFASIFSSPCPFTIDQLPQSWPWFPAHISR